MKKKPLSQTHFHHSAKHRENSHQMTSTVVEALFPAQEVSPCLFIVACGDWTVKLKRPGTHTTEMILVSMVLQFQSFQAFYTASEEEMNLE